MRVQTGCIKLESIDANFPIGRFFIGLDTRLGGWRLHLHVGGQFVETHGLLQYEVTVFKVFDVDLDRYPAFCPLVATKIGSRIFAMTTAILRTTKKL